MNTRQSMAPVDDGEKILADKWLAARRLETFRDGIAGVDLGAVGAFQYALLFGHAADEATPPKALAVYRRRADEAGTYGGWRWECYPHAPRQIKGVDELQELGRRIDAALTRVHVLHGQHYHAERS